MAPRTAHSSPKYRPTMIIPLGLTATITTTVATPTQVTRLKTSTRKQTPITRTKHRTGSEINRQRNHVDMPTGTPRRRPQTLLDLEGVLGDHPLIAATIPMSNIARVRHRRCLEGRASMQRDAKSSPPKKSYRTLLPLRLIAGSVRGRDRDNRSQGTKRESDDREARSSSRRPRPAHHRSPSRSDSSRKHRRPDYPRTPSVPTGPPPRAPSPPYRSQGNHPPPALSDISSPEILLYCDHDSGLGTSVPSTPSQAWASLSRSSSSRRSGSAGSTYTRPSCENEPRTNARTAGKDSDGKKYPPNSSRTKQDKAVGQQKKKSMSGSPCGSRSGSRSGSRDRGTRSSSSCDSAYYSRSASQESERKTRTEAGAYRLS